MNPTRNEAAEYAHLEMTQYWSAVDQQSHENASKIEEGYDAVTKNMDVFKRTCQLVAGIHIGTGKVIHNFESIEDKYGYLVHKMYKYTSIYANLAQYGSITFNSEKTFQL